MPLSRGWILWALRRGAVTMVVGGALREADAPVLCRRLGAVLDRCPVDTVACDVRGVTTADLGALEVVARLRMTAGRRGARFRLLGPPPPLAELVTFAGLGDMLTDDSEACG